MCVIHLTQGADFQPKGTRRFFWHQPATWRAARKTHQGHFFLSFSSSLYSFLSLSPSTPSSPSSKQDSGSTLFITHQHSLYKISPEMHTMLQLRFCQRLTRGPSRVVPGEHSHPRPPHSRGRGFGWDSPIFPGTQSDVPV